MVSGSLLYTRFAGTNCHSNLCLEVASDLTVCHETPARTRMQRFSTGMRAIKSGVIALARLVLLLAVTVHIAVTESRAEGDWPMKLPEAGTNGGLSVERALQQRRSVRTFDAKPLTLSEIGQLLWAAQGITHSEGLRTAPSAGALYPLEIYLVAGNISDLPTGEYHYVSRYHALERLADTDKRAQLARAALGQMFIRDAAAVVVFAGVYHRTTRKYGKRGIQYVHMEAGHAAENLFLQAVSLDLKTVIVGAFEDEAVANTLALPEAHVPLVIMPVGR